MGDQSPTLSPANLDSLRLCAREIKKAMRVADWLDPSEVFEAMPPSEGLKLLISDLQTGRELDKAQR